MLIAILVGILISVQVSYEDLGNFVFDFVPAIPTETMCYYSTMFISWSTCDLIPFLRKLHLIPTYPSCKMDENDILVTVVPAKGGIVLMSRMMLEWSWRCNMCMGMELSPHKSVPLNETGKGYWPPYEIDTPKHDSDILLAATLMKKWNHYARTQSDRVRCVVVTRDPIDRLRSHHTYAMSDGDYDLRELGLKMKQATSTGDALEIMWNRMARESMIRSHKYLTSALSLGCKQNRFEGFRENFNETVLSIFRAWNINPEVESDLLDIAVTHDLGRLSQKELNSNHHVSTKKFSKSAKREIVNAIRENEEISRLMETQRQELHYT